MENNNENNVYKQSYIIIKNLIMNNIESIYIDILLKCVNISNITSLGEYIDNIYYSHMGSVNAFDGYKFKVQHIIYFNLIQLEDFDINNGIKSIPNGNFIIYKDKFMNKKDCSGYFNMGKLNGYYKEYRNNWLAIVKYFDNDNFQFMIRYNKLGIRLKNRSYYSRNASNDAKKIFRNAPIRCYRYYEMKNGKKVRKNLQFI